MDWNRYPKRAAGLELSEVTDGFVVSRAGSDQIHYLNTVAAFILESCDGQLRAEELPELIADAFGLEQPPHADVEACLEALYRQGLIIGEIAR